jgi:hypothetical protein
MHCDTDRKKVDFMSTQDVTSRTVNHLVEVWTVDVDHGELLFILVIQCSADVVRPSFCNRKVVTLTLVAMACHHMGNICNTV